jgi:hypothetical protein
MFEHDSSLNYHLEAPKIFLTQTFFTPGNE